jgi:hypothetical protein
MRRELRTTRQRTMLALKGQLCIWSCP